ncbi:DUF3558 domain-containing protein [Streptomyces sp. 6N223]|uniref:DUF3558 domain-containing protein n=1 Tax=Streptomyces sp. 6N223 TaxID=3457412 RepID=UPI003FD2F53B
MRATTRTLPRIALAWAAVPVLLLAGCSGGGSGDSGEEAAAEDQQPRTQAPSPEPVRFSTLPEPCSTLGEDTVEQVVPKADPKRGDTLTTSDTGTSGACLWSGLKDYQFRSLTVSLRRFDSDLAIGSGDERAEDYMTQLVEEITGDDANKDVDEAQLAEPGEGGATSISYSVTKESEDGDPQKYVQQRVVARTGNVVVTIDYSGAGFEDADNPSVESVREDAETAATEVVAAVDASAAGQDEGQDGAGEGSEESAESSARDS